MKGGTRFRVSDSKNRNKEKNKLGNQVETRMENSEWRIASPSYAGILIVLLIALLTSRKAEIRRE